MHQKGKGKVVKDDTKFSKGTGRMTHQLNQVTADDFLKNKVSCVNDEDFERAFAEAYALPLFDMLCLKASHDLEYSYKDVGYTFMRYIGDILSAGKEKEAALLIQHLNDNDSRGVLNWLKLTVPEYIKRVPRRGRDSFLTGIFARYIELTIVFPMKGLSLQGKQEK